MRDFLLVVCDRRKEILYFNRSACDVGQNNANAIPECEVNGIECYIWRLSISDLFYFHFNRYTCTCMHKREGLCKFLRYIGKTIWL